MPELGPHACSSCSSAHFTPSISKCFSAWALGTHIPSPPTVGSLSKLTQLNWWPVLPMQSPTCFQWVVWPLIFIPTFWNPPLLKALSPSLPLPQLVLYLRTSLSVYNSILEKFLYILTISSCRYLERKKRGEEVLYFPLCSQSVAQCLALGSWPTLSSN